MTLEQEPGQAAEPEAAPKERPVSLRKNVLWTGLGNGVYLGCKYLLFMVLAKLGSPALVGQYALAQAITTPPIVFSQMQLRKMQVTDAKGDFMFADYFAARLLLTVVALMVIMVIVFVSSDSPQTKTVILLIGLANAFESMSDVAYGKMQKHERMRLIAISMMIKGVGSATAFGVLLGLLHSLVYATAGMAAAWGVLFLAYDLPNARRVSPQREPLLVVRPAVIWRLCVLAAPLALAGGISSVMGNIPRYYLQSLCNARTLGFFSAAASPLVLIQFFCGALTDASIARAARYYQEGKMAAFKSLALKVTALQVAVGVAFTLLFALCGQRLFSILFTPEYAFSARASVVMASGIAIGNLAAFGSLTLSAARMFKVQLILVAVMLAIQIPVAHILTARWGLMGASWAEFVRYCVVMVILTVVGTWVLVMRQRDLTRELTQLSR